MRLLQTEALLIAFSCFALCTVLWTWEENVTDHGRPALTQRLPLLADVSIEELSLLQAQNVVTSVSITQTYIHRIGEVNKLFRCVSEINPDALEIARSLDVERAAGYVRGPLHGNPILLKDNIATLDQLNNTAGSFALLGATVSREATVATRLREAGAVILGKTSMGEWAQMRSTLRSSVHGWSAYGGQPLGPFYPFQNPSGSSSGSAVAAALGLSIGTVATETSGSILLPAEKSNLVGIKPTVGLVSRSMVIPISRRQDSVGPHAATVMNAAYMLSAMAGKDKTDNWTNAQPFDIVPDYVKACNISALQGIRLGVPRNGINYYASNSTCAIMDAFEEFLSKAGDAGATIVDGLNFAVFDPPAFNRNSELVLEVDFVEGLKEYLSNLAANPADIHTLEDLINFTKSDPREEWPMRDIEVWEHAVNRNLTTDSSESYEAYEANRRMAEEDGITGLLDRFNLDALIMPTFTAFRLPAIAGLPVITVPLGFFPAETEVVWAANGDMVDVAPGIPFGISFLGRKWSEETLIGLAYAYEQRTKAKPKPKPLVMPKSELGTWANRHAVMSYPEMADPRYFTSSPTFGMDQSADLSIEIVGNLSSIPPLLDSAVVSI